jgi:hypothetical protein
LRSQIVTAKSKKCSLIYIGGVFYVWNINNWYFKRDDIWA